MHQKAIIYRTLIFVVVLFQAAVLAASAQTAEPPIIRGERRAPFDFFGSGRTSFAVFSGTQSSRITWKAHNNGGPGTLTLDWGRRDFSFTDFPAPGYYDGDDKTDVAVFRKNYDDLSGSFFVNPSTAADAMNVTRWGLASDFSVSGDYDGDGRTDLAVTRRANGNWLWYILRSSDNSFTAVPLGTETPNGRTDATMRGADYNGDGRDDLVVRRADEAGNVTYYVGDSATGALILTESWGNLFTDAFVTGDYLGDERADFAVWRGFGETADGFWYIKENGGDRVLYVPFGIPGTSYTDRAIRGDYNGDGKDDIAIYRSRTSTFYWLDSPDYTNFNAFQFGEFGDVPVAGL